MNANKIIDRAKQEIVQKTNPISIFLYGSYTTPDYLRGVSDLEIGVLKTGKKSISKTLRTIAEKYSEKDARLRIYSYDLHKVKEETVDTPFTKSVFLRHLILTSKTIWEEQIMEELPLPSISLFDAYREACFSTMRALSAIFFLRAHKKDETIEMSYKACLFATRSLEYLRGEYPIGFQNIVKKSKKLNLDKEWKKLIEYAYNLRKGNVKPSKDELYTFSFNVITYCNQIVEERIKKELKKGDRIIVR